MIHLWNIDGIIFPIYGKLIGDSSVNVYSCQPYTKNNILG